MFLFSSIFFCIISCSSTKEEKLELPICKVVVGGDEVESPKEPCITTGGSSKGSKREKGYNLYPKGIMETKPEEVMKYGTWTYWDGETLLRTEKYDKTGKLIAEQ